MEIYIKKSYYSTNLIFKAHNVNVSEDVEVNVEGHRDIRTDFLDQIKLVMEDAICYREAPYDSTTLIEQLLMKLPTEKIKEVSKMLEDYE